jgi:hypothetical protein
MARSMAYAIAVRLKVEQNQLVANIA